MDDAPPAPPKILALSTAGRKPSAAIVQGDAVLATWAADGSDGLAASLPVAIADLVAAHGAPDLIAVCAGPGSFTGLRTGMSVAAGLAAGYAIDVVAVTQAEAMAAELGELTAGRALWTAVDSRRDRVFLDQGAGFASVAIADVQAPRAAIAVAGDATIALAASLAARGANVMLTGARDAQPRFVARAALLRVAGVLPPLACEPLYVDQPAVSVPAAAAAALG